MYRRIYDAAVVGLMLTSMGVVMGLASPGLSDTDLGVVDSQVHLPVIIATLVLYGVVLGRIFTDPIKILDSCMRMKALVPILLFSVVSAAWSPDPGTTIRRASFLVLTTLVGIVLGTDYEIPQIGRLVAVASAIHIAACCLLFVLARNILYSPSDPGSMKGLTTHKNVFGLEMGIATLVFLLVPFYRLGWTRWPLTLAAGTFLIMSHSTGSLISTLCALAFLPLMLAARFPLIQRVPLLLLAAIAVLGAGMLLYTNAALLPEVFSKDATLTGRTQLWALVLVAIGHHPWLGYGFDSFWQGLHGDSLTIIRGVGWLVPTAHNGYLDLLLGLGIVGAVLFLGPVVQMIARALRYLTMEVTSAKYFPIALIIYWLVYNLNESALLARSGMPLVFLIALSTSLSLQSHRSRIHGHAKNSVPYPSAYQPIATY